MPPIDTHDTAVVDQPWDGPAQVAKLSAPVTKAIGTGMFAWYDGAAADDNDDGYPDAKDASKFPHHEVSADGRPGAANVRALRNGLARLSQSDIPSADEAGVRKHLQHHLDAFNAKKKDSIARGSTLWGGSVVGKAWALRPEVFAVVRAALAAGEAPPMIPAGGMDEQDDLPGPGIIPLYGLITPHGGGLLSFLLGLGGGGLDRFRSRLSDAVEDPAVSHIVLDVDSPGGLVDLVPETAADVRAAAEVKPVIAVANTQAASAAYWIAAQASELVVTPSGSVGSIGVFMMHMDESGALEQEGIKTTIITAGKYKAERHWAQPLSSDAQSAMQQEVDDIYSMFVTAVAQGRSTTEQAVIDGYGQGRALLADRAVAVGLADRVGTLEDVIGGLITPTDPPADPDLDDEDEPEVEGKTDWAGAHEVLMS
jgi:signal peptide peptidase SppA